MKWFSVFFVLALFTPQLVLADFEIISASDFPVEPTSNVGTLNHYYYFGPYTSASTLQNSFNWQVSNGIQYGYGQTGVIGSSGNSNGLGTINNTGTAQQSGTMQGGGYYNYSYSYGQGILNSYGSGPQSLGTPNSTGTPNTVGAPGSLGVLGDTGYVPDPGIVPELGGKQLTPKKLDSRLIIERGGIGDQCKAGITAPAQWSISTTDQSLSKDELVKVVEAAVGHDTRLRSVRIVDEEIHMYYLQPAYYWNAIPTNYYLHISANGNSLHISLEKPKWLGRAKNFHAEATAAFSKHVPEYLNPAIVADLEAGDLMYRDGRLVEMIAAIMRDVQVSPISNSFFVCYIMPFLIYILLVLVVGGIAAWYIVRRIRKKYGYLVKRIHPLNEGTDHDEDDTQSGGHGHTTSFKLPNT